MLKNVLCGLIALVWAVSVWASFSRLWSVWAMCVGWEVGLVTGLAFLYRQRTGKWW